MKMPTQATKQKSSPPVSIPAPVGGWNTKDSLAAMASNQAVVLENWWPTTTDIVIRNGCTNYSTGLSGTVETLLTWNKTDGTRKRFAFTSTGNLYDVTTAGVVGAAKVTGLSNGRWQYASFATPAGNFILACNGLDYMLRYDGTNWITVWDGTSVAPSQIVGAAGVATVTTAAPHKLQTGNVVTVAASAPAGLDGTYTITRTGANTFTYANATVGTSAVSTYTVAGSITGISSASISNINVFKTRIWLVQKNSLSCWYLPSLAIAGAASEFPMGSVFSSGGYVVVMGTWTVDAGSGSDDIAVFFSSEGDVLQYKGTDPTSSTTFALIGLYRQGYPIGARCQIKYGGDIYIITAAGVFPLSRSVLTAQVTESAAITDKILPTMAAAVLANSGFGWEMVVYPSQNMLLINVPSTMGNYQLAMNTVTGAFTKFSNWNASTWCSDGLNIFYGMAGKVVQAWITTTDFGTPITAKALPAFLAIEGDGQKKLNLVRPIISSTGNPSFLIGLNYDYDTQTQPTGTLNFTPPSTGMTWGSMTWGSLSWGGALATNRQWQMAQGIGFTMSMYLIAQNNGSDVHWASTDYVYEQGGIL